MNDRAPPNGWDCHVHIFDERAAVLAGHYRPPTRSLAEIEATAAAADVGHLVLVQPSVYGSDNSLMLQALQASAGRHRGIAVVGPDVDEATLDAMHAAGVRGIRFNQVSPVGLAEEPATVLHRLAPRLRARGWHVQWYVASTGLAPLRPLQAETGLVFVLDHLAGMAHGLTADDPAWTALAELAAGGAWVKLSGWYRLNDHRPFAAMHPHIARVVAMFGPRTVWGSDWPHTNLGARPDLPYSATFHPLQQVLGDTAAGAVRDLHPQALYA